MKNSFKKLLTARCDSGRFHSRYMTLTSNSPAPTKNESSAPQSVISVAAGLANLPTPLLLRELQARGLMAYLCGRADVAAEYLHQYILACSIEGASSLRRSAGDAVQPDKRRLPTHSDQVDASDSCRSIAPASDLNCTSQFASASAPTKPSALVVVHRRHDTGEAREGSETNSVTVWRRPVDSRGGCNQSTHPQPTLTGTLPDGNHPLASPCCGGADFIKARNELTRPAK